MRRGAKGRVKLPVRTFKMNSSGGIVVGMYVCDNTHTRQATPVGYRLMGPFDLQLYILYGWLMLLFFFFFYLPVPPLHLILHPFIPSEIRPDRRLIPSRANLILSTKPLTTPSHEPNFATAALVDPRKNQASLEKGKKSLCVCVCACVCAAVLARYKMLPFVSGESAPHTDTHITPTLYVGT